MKNILAVGAFERHNFGDILFFEVLSRYISKIKDEEFNVIPASITYADMRAYFGREVYPYRQLLKTYKWDAVWVVGGEVGGADVVSSLITSIGPELENLRQLDELGKKQISDLLNSTSSGLAYIPNIADYPNNKNATYIINSVGGMGGIRLLPEQQQTEMIELLKKKNVKVTVRDDVSLDFLASRRVSCDIAPDTVHCIAELFPLKDETKQNRIVFQVSEVMSRGVKAEKLATSLISIATEHNFASISLFIAGSAHGHDSKDFYKDILSAIKLKSNILTEIYEDTNALNQAKYIGMSRLWIGSSLHGRIVACSYGVPRVSLDKGKLNTYSKKWDSHYPYGIKTEEIVQAATDALKVNEQLKRNDLSDASVERLSLHIRSIASHSKSSNKGFVKSRQLPITIESLINTIQANSSLIAENKTLMEAYSKSENNAKMYKNAYDAIMNSRAYSLGRVMLLPLTITKIILLKLKRHIGLWLRTKKLYKHIRDVYNLTKQGERVDIIIRSYHHPTSSMFIRLAAPFARNPLSFKYAIFFHDGEKSFRISKKTKVVIVQRTACRDLASAKSIVEQVRTHKALLFVDTDDAFGQLDKGHPQYEEQKHRVEALEYIMAHADDTWFSTEILQKSHDIVTHSSVVENTLTPAIWKRAKTKSSGGMGKPINMLYMGTTTHANDFDLVRPVLEKLHENYPGFFKLTLIGVAQGEFSEPWIEVLRPDSALYPDFITWLNKQGPFDVGLSPLVDNQFNKNKSDIKCLDYLALGILPVVSDLEPYRNKELDGLIRRLPNDNNLWYEILEHILLNKKQFRADKKNRIAKAQDYLWGKRDSSFAAQKIDESITAAYDN